ncbi:sel1 repeat family protein [Agrobacterium genomosp. 3]|uniref:tetratricopeptide repeat protein n=1 Tax=Agrobacterium tomkonis TaxID=1183410 RepID=UPI001CD83C13|nr:sel1 repeat family protein [Agrobacterium tomkonis]MCA1879911.1 sel1 repeat family protein [Agrobacterium tumefaciens]MCA1895169.1 sel1 repeat family protein [Agrobacterium tomkonis]
MRYFFLASVVVLFSTVLAGCELTSSKPLLDPTEAELAFGEQFVAVSFDKDTGSFLNDKGELSALTAIAKGTVYEIDGGNGGQGGTLRFHSARGLPFDYLLEMTGKDKTSYIAIRKTEIGLEALNIDLSSAVLATLEQRGIRPTKQGMEYRVESVGALEETVRAWADNVLAGKDGTEFPFRFEVASTEPASAALMARAMTELCLARAGHPLEPEVKQLRGKFAFGVAIDKIDIPAAKQACGWGADPGAPDSIRYTLARVYVQAQEYDRLPAVIEPLVAKDFGLVHLLRADQLMRGLGVAADTEAARRILEDAAPRHPVIAYNLGAMIAYGRFGEPDFVVARRLYEASAEAGISAAKVGLGFLYANGSGITKNEARAYALFKEAAEAKDLQGYMEAGRAMYFGIGTNQDFKAAYPYLKTAAEADLPEAQYIVGFMLARGQGTDKSESAAVNMLTKASDAGILSAKAELGWMIYRGVGVTADRAKGRKLLDEAAQEGNTAAKDYIASLAQPTLPELSSNVPGEVQADVQKLSGDQPFNLNRVNMPFMAGMAQYLGERCGLPSNLKDRMELAGLVLNGSSSVLGGNDYSNPDLGKAIGSMMGSTALFAAGAKFAEQIPCDSSLAEHMADRLVAASRSNKGGNDSPFIPSCSQSFDQARCACLAQIGRGVIPDIYQQTYDRSIIKEIISRNPLLGLTIGITCQIGNY